MGADSLLCPVMRPTREEFALPFTDYVRAIFNKHPGLALFKIVPPPGWKPRRSKFPDLQEVTINTPIRQHVFGTKGAYRCLFIEHEAMSVAKFKALAEEETALLLAQAKRKEKRLGGSTEDAMLERSFWSSVTLNPPLYGADTPTSFFDPDLSTGWNLQNLGDLLKTHNMPDIPGVTTPMTYFGMWRSFFGWHVEDADLYSVNFVHFGAPKVWYGVSPKDRARFERMAQNMFPQLHRDCQGFIRHKDIMLSPALLRMHNIPYMQAKQEAGEFVVLNAAAYHSGFNMGFNCAEAVNFGLDDWIPIGKAAEGCTCDALKDGVRINMRIFDPSWHGDSDSSNGSNVDIGSEEPAARYGSSVHHATASSSSSSSNSDVDSEDSTALHRSKRCCSVHASEQGVHRAGKVTREVDRVIASAPGRGSRHRECSGRSHVGIETVKGQRQLHMSLPPQHARLPPAGQLAGELRSPPVVGPHGTRGPRCHWKQVERNAVAAAGAAATEALSQMVKAHKHEVSKRQDGRSAAASPSNDEGSSKGDSKRREERPSGVRQSKRRRPLPCAASPRPGASPARAGRRPRKAAAPRQVATLARLRDHASPDSALPDASVAVLGPPFAVVWECKGKRSFRLVQRLKRPSGAIGCVLLQGLTQSPADGLFRPVKQFYEERADCLVSVRSQSRILEETDLVDG